MKLLTFLILLAGSLIQFPAIAGIVPAQAPDDGTLYIIMPNASLYGGMMIDKSSSSGWRLYMTNNASKWIRTARYDVLKRVSFQDPDNSSGSRLCLTVPKSLQRASPASWDYIQVDLCAINRKDQQWEVGSDGRFTATHFPQLQVGDMNWMPAMQSTSNKIYLGDAFINDVVSIYPGPKWWQTNAQPADLNIQVKIVGDSNPPYGSPNVGNDLLFNSTIIKSSNIYNPETKQIQFINYALSKVQCISGPVGKTETWDWLKAYDCNTSGLHTWSIDILGTGVTGSDGSVYNPAAVTDEAGNILSYSGYSAWLSNLKGYSKYNSLVWVGGGDRTYADWSKFSLANEWEYLKYCPASSATPRSLRSLPSSWITGLGSTDIVSILKRMYAISMAGAGPSCTGGWGPCVVHSLEMIAELYDWASAGTQPYAYGEGRFFNVIPGDPTDPINRVAERFPSIGATNSRIARLANEYNAAITSTTPTTDMRRFVSMMLVSGAPLIFFPDRDVQYRFSTPPFGNRGGAQSPSQVYADTVIGLQSFMDNHPVGTTALIHFQGRDYAHDQPIIHFSDGWRLLATNNGSAYSLHQYIENSAPTNSATDILFRLDSLVPNQVMSFDIVEIGGLRTVPFSNTVSVGDCIGLGSGRRGSGLPPASSSVNQCFSGRCTLQ